ncbi:hypothetical protein GCM10009836_15450 [Pseudonocardia ailaonensis]|uniref:DUF397 domain-containing protein n=1 Tax=Pseudonocardia ailaonensis TaxID=367279 RepID=A0ABN2MU47_9PSEU
MRPNRFSPAYRTSSFCASGQCVEVAELGGGRIAVRDSKNRLKPRHVFTADEWEAFVRGVKAGEFDLTARGPETQHRP